MYHIALNDMEWDAMFMTWSTMMFLFLEKAFVQKILLSAYHDVRPV